MESDEYFGQGPAVDRAWGEESREEQTARRAREYERDNPLAPFWYMRWPFKPFFYAFGALNVLGMVVAIVFGIFAVGYIFVQTILSLL